MTVTPPNYNTITIQDGSLEDDTKQGQTESTTTTHTFLPSSLLVRNKWWVTVLVVIVGGILYLTGGLSRPQPIQGTQGTCRPSSSPSSSSLTIMTFNTYLIYCLPFGLIIPCEEAARREERLPPMADWFAQRDEDVVLLQEIWSFREDVLFALTEQAGYCHYTMAGGTTTDGSGLAIFSKHEIIDHDFRRFGLGWYTGWGLGTVADALLFGKGVLYAKIRKEDGQVYHVFNTHTVGDMRGDEHHARVLQYQVLDDFVRSKAIPNDELVVIGGDMNEEKDCQKNDVVSDSQEPVHVCNDQEYYQTMLETLSTAFPPLHDEDLKFTYTSDNPLVPRSNRHYNQLIDYILYRDDHIIPHPNATDCTILHVRDPSGNDLSKYVYTALQ